MKKFAVLAAFAVFAAAIVSNAAVSAVEPMPAKDAAKSVTVMPVTQELPFDRYWSKD